MKTIVFAAQKGGTSKTSSAIITAYAMAAEGKKIVFLDLDSQCNSTEILRSGASQTDKNVLDILHERVVPGQALQACDIGYLIAASAYLTDGDIKSLQSVKTILNAIQSKFDYAIIDTPPALGMTTLSALASADYVVIPSRADPMGVAAVKNTLDTVQTIRDRANRGLRAGILPTMYNARTTLNRTYLTGLQDIGKAYGARTFSAIRNGIAVPESQAMQESLFDYAPRASVTSDYKTFYQELKEEI